MKNKAREFSIGFILFFFVFLCFIVESKRIEALFNVPWYQIGNFVVQFVKMVKTTVPANLRNLVQRK